MTFLFLSKFKRKRKKKLKKTFCFQRNRDIFTLIICQDSMLKYFCQEVICSNDFFLHYVPAKKLSFGMFLTFDSRQKKTQRNNIFAKNLDLVVKSIIL